jgi:single-strand DNA-binding protein
MAASLNKVTLIGRVGKDPEVRSLNNGGKVANFTLATSESWKDKRSGEKKEHTDWHNIVVWPEGTVNFIDEYVRKGDLLYVEGKIETRKWKDQEDNDRYTTEIVVKPYNGAVNLLSSKDNNGGGNGRDRGREDRGDDRRGRGDDSRGGRDNDRSGRGRDDRRDDRGRSDTRGRTQDRRPASAQPDLDDDIPF